MNALTARPVETALRGAVLPGWPLLLMVVMAAGLVGCSTGPETPTNRPLAVAPGSRSKIPQDRRGRDHPVVAVLPETAAAIRAGAPRNWQAVHQGLSAQEVHDLAGPPWRSNDDAKRRVEIWCRREGAFVWNMQVIYDASGKAAILRSYPALAVPVEEFRPKNSIMIPPSVRQEVQERVQKILPEADFRGVPLLDAGVDWTDLRNWPDQFAWGGVNYRMKVTEGVSDPVEEIPSRQELRTGVGFVIRYEGFGMGVRTNPLLGSAAAPANALLLQPAAYWRGPGVLHGESLKMGAIDVFSIRFYASGELQLFDRSDANVRRVDVFTRRGRVLGSLTGESGLWKGTVVTSEDFWKLFDQWLARAE